MGSTAKSAPKRTSLPTDFVSWFEIPAYDLGRAKAFYDQLYGIHLETSVAGDYVIAFFPSDKGIGGAIVQGPGCLPNDSGTLVYLNAGDDLDGMLSRVEIGGGRIIMGRSLISDSAGWFALFIDSEGNRMALHAPAKPAQKATSAKETVVTKKAPATKPKARKGAGKKSAPRKEVKRS